MNSPLQGRRIGLLAGWASRKNGGVFEALVQQVELIRELGGEPWVFAARDEWLEEDQQRLGNAQLRFGSSVGPASLAFSPALSAEIDKAQLDCLHLHGIWQGSSWTCAGWSQHNPGRTIISPHGMLDPWITGRNRLKKRAFRIFVERQNWRSAAVFHALTGDEAADIARWTGGKRTETIPNPAPSSNIQERVFPPPEVLYLGRLHPKKNLAALIEGWASVLPSLPEGARLTIAGSGDDDHAKELRHLVANAGASVSYVGAAYGAEKEALLKRARFMILPSHSEGLPMAVLEAWAAGMPTIMTEACHLPEGYRAGAAIRCGTGSQDIAAALKAAFLKDGPEWLHMSDAAMKLASGPFSRTAIASRWAKVYGSVMGSATHG